MRWMAVILAVMLAATAARGELNLTTNDAWQDIIQATNSVAINLAPGTYAVAGQLYFYHTNANITLTGNYDTRDEYGVTSNGQAEVVMTGGGTGRVIYVDATNITIRGVTITGGHTVPTSYGAGIDARYAGHYLLDRCNVVSNTSTAGIAGAHNGNLVNSTIGYNITSNSTGDTGGAKSCTVSNCVVVGNSAVGAGVDIGGLNTCTVYDSIIKGNTAQRDCGAAYNTYFHRCTIVSNASGGGFVVYKGGMEDSIVEYNTAADLCAGLGYASASNTIFRFNSARQAGALYNVNGWGLTVQSNVASTANGAASGGTFYYSLFQGNCTTSSASTGGGAGGVASVFNAYSCVFDGNYVTRAGYPQAINDANDIRNCTFVNHTTNGPVVTGWKTTSMVYNCIFWNNTSNYIADTTNLANNLIGVDPLFIAGPTNYLISSESPAIDAGDDTKAAPGADFYGRDRTTGLAVDIGAVEYQTADEPKAVGTRKKLLMMLLGGH